MAVLTRTKFAELLNELRETERQEAQGFVHVGQILKRLRDDGLWEEAGFGSWKEACESSIGYSSSQANKTIQAAMVSEELNADPASKTLTSREQLIQIARLETKRDRVRIARKVGKLRQQGKPCGGNVVKQIVDDEKGVTRKKRERKFRDVALAATPAEAIAEMTTQVGLWQTSLEAVSGEFWTDAEQDSPGCVKALSAALSNLASYLRS